MNRIKPYGYQYDKRATITVAITHKEVASQVENKIGPAYSLEAHGNMGILLATAV
ncbi:hypothetical protein [Pectobacterium carotovorum]|uniref:hypothetical protein n=1 Tax=Pectobacterium carotovorum TaxID=554 RepID=UPI00027E2F9B|nr:hypothetical protein [Pectobacterium carotovorum]AFR05133.1 hypothetical protein PCC21_037300 [Pectobacterium carotovorum subsp. carotovorum PCC21]